MSAATTPHRTNIAAQHSPSKTPARRALGDLTPKAINTPTKAAEPSEVARAQSPLKQITTHAPTVHADKENLATPKGKKRSIDEVDSAETVENLKMLARGRDDSLLNTGLRLTTDAMQQHTNNPIGLADPGSPTERATPSPVLEAQPEPIQFSQKSNQSFSDLLNYEMCASQKSEHVAPAVPAPEPRKSRAEQLRTRLKFGLYKVKTNQVNKRDADIISAGESFSSILNASTSGTTAMTSSSESLGPHGVPNITVSSPRRDQRPVFVQANLDPFRPIGKLGQPPVQFAIPSSAQPSSSRMIQTYDDSSSHELAQSVSPEQLMSPVRQRVRYDTVAEHDGDDASTRGESAHERFQRLREQQYREGDSMSRSVQGNAAKGLLELSTGAR